MPAVAERKECHMHEALDAAIAELKEELAAAVAVADQPLAERIAEEIRLIDAVGLIIDNGQVEEAIDLLRGQGLMQ